MKLIGKMNATALITVALALPICAGTAVPAAADDGRNAALFGGLAAGAIIGGALASGPHYYAPAYPPAPIYAPEPVYYADCFFERRPMFDGWGNFVGYRRVRVCN
jgi:hypothetical protein